MMKEILSLLRSHGYSRVSLSVQKANYAAKLYLNVGFEIVRENEEEYINLSDISKMDLSITFNGNDICIVSVPSFSGRVPQFIIPILQHLQGNKAKAILISTYGNRTFDDTLLELKDTMEQSGFLCYCALAAVTRHSVIPKYGAGRPDSDDIAELKEFSIQCREIFKEPFFPIDIPGDNYRKCDTDICISCLQCISACPKKARHVNALILKIAEWKMKKLCSGRKPNVLFLPPKQTQSH